MPFRNTRLLKLFWSGLFISLIGTLPPGILNLLVFRLFIHEGLTSAFLFATGVVLVEMIYVYITLLFMQKIQTQIHLKRYITGASWIIASVFAILSVYDALIPGEHTGASFLFPSMPRFIYGMILSLINPIQIVFWMGWNTILLSRNLPITTGRSSWLYITGIGIGTLLGFAAFMILGHLLKDRMADYNAILKWVTALLFIGFLFLMLFKSRKDRLRPFQNEAKLSGKTP